MRMCFGTGSPGRRTADSNHDSCVPSSSELSSWLASQRRRKILGGELPLLPPPPSLGTLLDLRCEEFDESAEQVSDGFEPSVEKYCLIIRNSLDNRLRRLADLGSVNNLQRKATIPVKFTYRGFLNPWKISHQFDVPFLWRWFQPVSGSRWK